MRFSELIRQIPRGAKERVFYTCKEHCETIQKALERHCGLTVRGTPKWEVSPKIPPPLTDLELPDEIALFISLQPILLQSRRGGIALSYMANQHIAANPDAWDQWGRKIDEFNKSGFLFLKDNVSEIDKVVSEINLILDTISQAISSIHSRFHTLGIYDPGQEKIEIYSNVIALLAKMNMRKAEEEALVTFTHEMAHAYTHIGFDKCGHQWPTDAFGRESGEIIEGLAQYYTHQVLTDLSGQDLFKKSLGLFNKAIPSQPPVYGVHKRWLKSYSPDEVREAMLDVRRGGGDEQQGRKKLLSKSPPYSEY